VSTPTDDAPESADPGLSRIRVRDAGHDDPHDDPEEPVNSTVDGEQQPQQPSQQHPADADEQQDPAQRISGYREEIDWLDAEILRLVKRRSEISQQVGEARMAAGGTRVVYNREMDVLARYRELGPEGRELAMILLRLGRGHLGR